MLPVGLLLSAGRGGWGAWCVTADALACLLCEELAELEDGGSRAVHLGSALVLPALAVHHVLLKPLRTTSQANHVRAEAREFLV